MRKLTRLFIVVSLILLCGCSMIQDDGITVEPPEVNRTPISGKWTVTKVVFLDDAVHPFEYKRYVGRDVIFAAKGVIFDNFYYDDPSLRSKVVNADGYLEKNYKVSKKLLGMDSDRLVVVNIYNQKDLIYQVLKTRSDQAYMYYNGVFLQLTRIADHVSDEDYEHIKSVDQSELINLNEKLNENSKINGLLIGYKSNNNTQYNSVYLKFVGDTLESQGVYNGLLIPKNDSIIKMDVQNGIPYANQDGEDFEMGNNQAIEQIEMLFVSEMYISYYEKQAGEEKLVFKFTDDIGKENRLGLSSVTKGSGDAFKIFRDSAKEANNGNGYINDLNFGVTRDDGKFKVIGLILERNESGDTVSSKMIDVNISANQIIDETDMKVSMSDIRERLPLARDAIFTSNNRFLVTMENDKLKIYNVYNTEVGSNLVAEMELPEDATIVGIQRFVGNTSNIVERKLY
ncbi:hypothetical protein O6R05_04320 [Peptoniphilus equinus]|uniref:Lipoprotein n=1 Tax=Peptoniphilus equinus TaxID=3016343 RepID=A0ABY7QRZ6_9FIRM|nr:hypothetical protein [Peptoniphilus equinus]WBW49241.1 hypothetical protein O6R05_04320 [Peptoniphilus equinus]